MDKEQQTCVICEQGDMGLFADPLSEKDQQKYNENKETKADE